jgi:hypothetical protein
MPRSQYQLNVTCGFIIAAVQCRLDRKVLSNTLSHIAFHHMLDLRLAALAGNYKTLTIIACGCIAGRSPIIRPARACVTGDVRAHRHPGKVGIRANFMHSPSSLCSIANFGSS